MELVRGHRRVFLAGSQLDGEDGDCPVLYMIVAGRVLIERRHPAVRGALVLAELGPGDLIGSPIPSGLQVASVTAVAIEETEVVELEAQHANAGGSGMPATGSQTDWVGKTRVDVARPDQR